MGKIDETGYEYYDSGIKQREYEYTYKDDAKLIQIKEYYEAGNMRSDIHYKMPIGGSYLPGDNDEDGSCLLYVPNGILGYEGQYLNGNRIGVHVSNDQETGAKYYETHYDNEGNKTKFIVFNKVSGEIESVEEFGQ
jgi:antitoxin component YwqK of YwqJK toxin-antitoxin module